MSRKPATADHTLHQSLPSLPSSQSPLIGREREVTGAIALLKRDDVRVLTLTGTGGIGKTRLAIEVATVAGASLAHGVRFISFASISNARLVPTTLARAFNLVETNDIDMHRALTDTLHEAEMLLVLDNFEHVASAAPFLNELLGECPRIRILVTSRTPLHITGEHLFPVPPLDLPDPGESQSLAQLETSPAVQLFVNRAQAVDPTFALTEANASVIGAICYRLDGLPLAIELAAAQSNVLPPAALLARIGTGMPLPVFGPRDAPDRHRTLHDAISWSYNLLSPEEQRLFRCTGVFVDGFGLDAAQDICHAFVTHDSGDAAEAKNNPGPDSAPPKPQDIDVLSGLASLVDSSLVNQAAWEGDARFSLLETIQGFSRDQLSAQDEYDAVRDAHAAWYLDLAEQSHWSWLKPGGEHRLRRLEIEHSNLLAALEWFQQRGDSERLLRMGTVLGGFWYAHSHYREGSIWLEKALASVTSAADVSLGRARAALGMLLNLQGDSARAEEFLAQGLSLLKGAEDHVTIALVLVSQGTLGNFRGDYQQAEHFLNEALHLQANIPDSSIAASIEGRAWSNLGVAAQGQGKLDLAIAHHERALRIYRQHGNILGVIRALCDRGEIASDRGDYIQTLRDFQESLSLMGTRGDLRVMVDALEGAALAAAAWDQPHEAARLLGAAEAVGLQIGASATIEADRLARERALAAIRATLDEQEIQSAWDIGRNLSLTDAIAQVLAMSPPGAPEENVDRSGVKLSTREKEVLRMLVEGYSDRAIAEALFLSVRTVEAHVTRIRVKLGVRTRTAAVTAAIVSGLVDPLSPEES